MSYEERGFERIRTLPTDITSKMISWLNRLESLEPEVYRGMPTCRKMQWFGVGTNAYQDPAAKPFPAYPIEKVTWINNMRAAYYPKANSVLIYEYPEGGSIGNHVDKGFDRKVVMVNLLDVTPNLFGEKEEKIKFNLGWSKYELGDGDVIRFDSHIEHSIPSIPYHRYSIQLRRIQDD